MSGLQTLATLTRRGAGHVRRREVADGSPAGRPRAAAAGEFLERCRRFGELHRRWIALTTRPDEDLDPDSPAGREATAVRENLEGDLRWLEARPARTAAEAEAKLAVALALAAVSGDADARYTAFLARAHAERAGYAGTSPGRASLLSARGLFGAVGLRR